MAAWGKWMEDNSSALKDPGNPVGPSKTVSPSGVADGGGANPEHAASFRDGTRLGAPFQGVLLR